MKPATRTLRQSSILALAPFALAACASTMPRLAPQPTTVAQAPILDTIAARLVSLELERAKTRAIFERWAPANTRLDDQIAALQEQLLAQSTAVITPRKIMLQVLGALEAHKAELVVAHRQLLVRYEEESLFVKRNIATQEALDERRAELRASLGLARGATGAQ